jgi:hypothetical protein
VGNCAGVDWAAEKHDLLIEDLDGRERLAATFAHDESGISALCAALVSHQVEVIAIERPGGVLVERLLETGVKVLALHPNQVAAARDRFRASGGKSDRFDAFVLCELARTDAHRFRMLEPDSDQTKAIQALVRAREDLVAVRVAMALQLRAELERFWPGPIRMFKLLHSRISLAFLERYPSPEDARLLAEKRLTAFLKANRYSNRRPRACCLSGSAVPRPGGPGRSSREPAGRSCSGSSARFRCWVIRSVSSKRKSHSSSTLTPTGRSSAASSGPAPRSCAPPRCWRRSVTAAPVTRTVTRSPPTPVKQPSRWSPANTRKRLSAGRATNTYAARSAPSRTAPGNGTPGRLTSTSKPAYVAMTTNAHSEPSDVPGAGSSGTAGRPAPPMTPSGTPACNDTSPSPSPARWARGPTSPQPKSGELLISGPPGASEPAGGRLIWIVESAKRLEEIIDNDPFRKRSRQPDPQDPEWSCRTAAKCAIADGWKMGAVVGGTLELEARWPRRQQGDEAVGEAAVERLRSYQQAGTKAS